MNKNLRKLFALTLCILYHLKKKNNMYFILLDVFLVQYYLGSVIRQRYVSIIVDPCSIITYNIYILLFLLLWMNQKFNEILITYICSYHGI